MHDPSHVGRLQGGEDLQDDPHRLGRRQRPALAERLLQGLSLDQLHDEESLAVGERPEVGDADDARVVDEGGRAPLAHEPDRHLRVEGDRRVQQLDRHGRAAAVAPRAEHDPHRAPPDLAVEVVRPDPAVAHRKLDRFEQGRVRDQPAQLRGEAPRRVAEHDQELAPCPAHPHRNPPEAAAERPGVEPAHQPEAGRHRVAEGQRQREERLRHSLADERHLVLPAVRRQRQRGRAPERDDAEQGVRHVDGAVPGRRRFGRRACLHCEILSGAVPGRSSAAQGSPGGRVPTTSASRRARRRALSAARSGRAARFSLSPAFDRRS